MNEFAALEDTPHLVMEWAWMYNIERSNIVIGGITSAMEYKGP